MNNNPAQLINLFLLTAFLVSPFLVASYLANPQVSTSNSIAGPPIETETKQPKTKVKESKFALLLKQEPTAKTKVLGAKTPQETPQELPRSSSYTIALLGDSMIDVMQPELPQLKSALQALYPQTEFKLINYGVGASDIESGLKRLTSGYNYLGKSFSSLLSQNPDIIVVESFAYNHWDNDQGNLDRQWLTIAKIIDTIKNQSQAKIVLAATIGPDQTTLCDGIEGISLTPEQKWEKAQTIRAYLQNLVNFATSQGYPLADAYHASLDKQGNGKAIYVNSQDHLHPSGPGGELLAKKIAEAIFKNNLLGS